MDFSLQRYIPFHLLSIHLTAATHERVQLQWPRAGGEAARQAAASSELLHSWCAKLPPAVARSHNVRSLLLDVVPCIKRMVCPSIRAVAQHLLLPDERAALAHTVGIMLDYGIAFDLSEPAVQQLKPWQQRQLEAAGKAGAAAGALAGAALPRSRPVPLAPAVDTLHVYRDQPPVPEKPMPLVLRQLVAQQVANEAIRRAEAARSATHTAEPAPAEAPVTGSTGTPGGQAQHGKGGFFGHHNGASKPAATKGSAAGGGGAEASAVERARMAKLGGGKRKPLEAAAAMAAVKAPANWLAALRTNAENRRKGIAAPGADGTTAGGGGGGGKTLFPVSYHFNEGFTSAVKRPLLMKELL